MARNKDMQTIQMVDLNRQTATIKAELATAIDEVIAQSNFINGPQVANFAHNLANYNGSGYCIPCANGTDALQIALMALNLQPGDEVILPVFTYVATAEVVALLGLSPVLVDVDPFSFCINVDLIEALITPKTKAIVPVHLFGQCAHMETIMHLAQKHNLYIIEDNAQAIGAQYFFSNGANVRSGAMGHFGTTSFFPSKNLGAFGDGGALFTNDQSLAIRAKAIANHGQLNQKYYHDIIGINSRLDTIQAAILNVKLKYLNTYMQARQRVAQAYNIGFAHLNTQFTTPVCMEYSTHVYHQYTIKLTQAPLRTAFIAHLKNNGIPSMVYYPLPLHQQKAFKSFAHDNDFEVANDLSSRVVSLPIHTEMQNDEITFIIDTVNQFFHDR